MSIAALNEQLLRAVGVGIALFEEHPRTLQFCNETFDTWFGAFEPERLFEDVFEDIDLDAMAAALDASGQYTNELSFRRKRRTLVINQTVTRTQIDGKPVLIVECQNITRIRELESMLESYARMVERNTREIQREKNQVEKLLLNILPRGAYEEFKTVGVVTPACYDNVGVLVLDFLNFGEVLDAMPPTGFVGELNELYSAFDRIAEQMGCERIRTTGDMYLSIVGLQSQGHDETETLIRVAARFQQFIALRNARADAQWQVRIGLAVGSVVGSVIGSQNFVYDVVGPAVVAANAARDAAQPMTILADASLSAAVEGFAYGAPDEAGRREISSLTP